MPARDELASALLECLREVNSLLESSYSTALRQRDALVSNDAEAIAITCVSQDEILRRVVQADERAAAVSAQIGEEAGLDIETADASTISAALEAPYEALVSRELGRISDIAQRVRDANEINSTLINNGLEVITSCLRIVAREPEPIVYSNNASFAGSGNTALSLDSRV